MAWLVAGSLFTAIAAPTVAAAQPPALPPKDAAHPLYGLVDRERASELRHANAARVLRRSGPAPQQASEAPSTLDATHAVHQVRLDPATGITSGTLDLDVRANGGVLTSVGLVLDEGLRLGAVTAAGRTVTVDDQTSSPTRVVRIDLSPPLLAGQATTLHVPFDGTLSCGTYAGGGLVCTKGNDFSYFAHESIFPYIFDPTQWIDTSLDALTREIVLRVPANTDVVATGESMGETFEGDTKVSRWTIDRPLSRQLGLYAFAGKLGKKEVTGRTVPTRLVFPLPEATVDERLAAWSSPVLDFVEQASGRSLPFERSLTLVRLPADLRDPGTATFGMTLLSDDYARAGDLMHEETWAHENTHLFWGIVVPEVNVAESRLMSEGIATLSEIDYTWAHHFANQDRETYLARRFLPIGLDLWKEGKGVPPVVMALSAIPNTPSRTSDYMLWAYYKTSATLDHLRATIGDDVFNRVLSLYVERCSYVGCRPDDFRTALEEVTQRDMAPFFGRWMTNDSRPNVTVGFVPGNQGGADIELVKDDEIPMTLDMWLELGDGQTVKQRIDLAGKVTHAHVDTGAVVRRVLANPRHGVLVASRSAVDGDIDFDGEADGFDILSCVTSVGRKYVAPSALGLWTVDESFDPRCDVNQDLAIDDKDIARLADGFGTLRSR